MSRIRLRLAGPARRDLQAIAAESEARWGGRQRAIYRENFNHAFSRIRDNIAIGRRWPDAEAPYRCWPCGRHVIFYRQDDEGVLVVRILHERMDARHRMGLNEAPAAYAP